MIISVEELQDVEELQGVPAPTLERKAKAIEALIRDYTNNNFQNRFVRFTCANVGAVLQGTSPYLRVNDTVEINNSMVNDGLYTITAIGDGTITVDSEDLYDVPSNMVTKVEYPVDIKEGVINMMVWEHTYRGKIGLKSETLSRHSVTYADYDRNNQVQGYPVTLLGFLDPYMKARF